MDSVVAWPLKSSGVKAADALIKSGASWVNWIAFSDSAACTIQLNDSLANDGTDQFDIDIPAGGYGYINFGRRPLKFTNGIYLDVSTASCKITLSVE